MSSELYGTDPHVKTTTEGQTMPNTSERDNALESPAAADKQAPDDDACEVVGSRFVCGTEREGVYYRHYQLCDVGGSKRQSLVASTDDAVDMGGFREILSHKKGAIDWSAARALLFNHNPDYILGTVSDIRIEGNQLMADFDMMDGAKLPSDVRADKAVESGALRGVSIGYTYTHNDVEYNEERSELRVSKWRLLEITLTPIPADPAAGVRSRPVGNQQPETPAPQERSVIMSDDTNNVPDQPGPDSAAIETAKREAREAAKAEAREIAILGRTHGVAPDELLDLGLQGAKDKVLKIVAERAKAPAPAQVPTQVTADEADKYLEAAEEGLMRGSMGIQGIFRRWGRYSGRDDVMDMDNMQLGTEMQRSIAMGTRDAGNKSVAGFSNLLANVQNKMVVKGFDSFEGATWGLFTETVEVPDFKQVTHTGLASGRLIETPENVAFPELSQADGVYNSQLGLWGCTVSLSYQALVNDDLGEFMKQLRRAGAIAAQTIDRETYKVLLNADYTNDVTASAALGTAGNIDKVRADFREKLGPADGGDGAGVKMGNVPRYLLVDASNRYNADIATGQLYGVQTGGNAMAGSNAARQIQVIESVYIGDTTLFGSAATTDYYMLGNPMAVDTLCVTMLRGVRQPVVQMYDAGAVAAEKYKVMLPFDVTQASHTDSAGNLRQTGVQKATA